MVADAILDHLLHHVNRLMPNGKSLRRRHPKSKSPAGDPA